MKTERIHILRFLPSVSVLFVRMEMTSDCVDVELDLKGSLVQTFLWVSDLLWFCKTKDLCPSWFHLQRTAVILLLRIWFYVQFEGNGWRELGKFWWVLEGQALKDKHWTTGPAQTQRQNYRSDQAAETEALFSVQTYAGSVVQHGRFILFFVVSKTRVQHQFVVLTKPSCWKNDLKSWVRSPGLKFEQVVLKSLQGEMLPSHPTERRVMVTATWTPLWPTAQRYYLYIQHQEGGLPPPLQLSPHSNQPGDDHLLLQFGSSAEKNVSFKSLKSQKS